MLAAKERTDRHALIDQFLHRSGYGDAVRDPLKGDASFRRYERIRRANEIKILMDAPPPKEDVRPFITVTHLLRAQQLSAPEILAKDEDQGFLLLEELGDQSYTIMLQREPQRELELYRHAVEVLVALYHAQEQMVAQLGIAIEPYDHATLLREANLVVEWFLPQVVGLAKAAELKASYVSTWEAILRATPLRTNCAVLRDYHADNLMWLPERSGIQKVGLLDYQDARMGDPAYDLVSFLEDIRRNVAPETIESLLDFYISETGQDNAEFMTRYSVLGAQRNSKIVGIFTRLCVRDNKPHYLNWLPSVWRWLEYDLSQPALAPLKAWFDEHVPESARGVIAADPTIGSLV